MKAELYLPWPNEHLSPNARVHWSVLHAAKKRAKDAAFYICREAKIGKIEAASLKVRYTFYPPSRRRFDQDNLVASLKAANDGIALAIRVDDSRWQIEVASFGGVYPGGRVKVEIEEV